MFKKNFLTLVLPILMFVACNKESDKIVGDNTNTSTEYKTLQGVIGESEFPYIIGNAIVSSDKMQLKSAGVWDGPYYTQGTLTKVNSNIKLSLDGSKVPGIASGIYFCDVYSYHVTVNLPTNSIARVNIVSPCGYTSVSTQEIGVNFTQTITSSGNSLYMNTFTIVIKNNLLGQTIGLVRPVDGNTITYSYSVMTY